MRTLRRLAYTSAIALAVASPAFAQQIGTGTGGNIGTPATQATTQTNTSGTGSTTSGIPGASSTPQTNFQQAPQITAPSVNASGNSNSGIASSNILRNTFGNPYYQGINLTNMPGGFGTALYPAATSTGTRGGAQGARGSSGSVITDQGGILVPLPRQIAYASQIQFKMPAGNPLPQLQLDLRGSIDRVPTTMLANPAGVKVEVDGRSVVLRGSVRDEEESHLVEGLVRLTPGVAAIKNELTYTK